MKNTLIDAGPLIALFDKTDAFHSAACNSLSSHKCKLITTWPVVTEVMHMISFSVKAQQGFIEWIIRGGLNIEPLESIHLKRILDLLIKFEDLPMDLADASLVVLAVERKLDSIFTLDSDFKIYRTFLKKPFRNMMVI